MPNPIPTLTRDDIISFIKANQYHSNPGSVMVLSPASMAPACRYFEGGAWGDTDVPSCVIGNVLFLKGIKPSVVYIRNNGACTLFYELHAHGVLDAIDVGYFASDVQKYADRGYTWGTALQLALIQRGES